LRKGGIHEGRGGFEFKHREFLLFPTWFHTQGERLKWRPQAPERFEFPPEEEERTSVEVLGGATLETVWRVTDWGVMEALAPFHVWAEEIVRERFAYDEESCLNVALVRAWRLPERWEFPYEKAHGGCRSWVEVPEPPAAVLAGREAAMAEEKFMELRAALQGVIS
jgi:hypothetical protein